MYASSFSRLFANFAHDTSKTNPTLRLALILSTVLHLVAPEPGWLSITPTEDVFLKPLKANMFFTCTARGTDDFPTDLQWLGPDGVAIKRPGVAGTERIYTEGHDDENLMLYIADIQTSDAGDYTCKGRGDVGPVSKTITLTVFKDITFSECKNIQNPIINTDAVVKCRVSGIPTPVVAWRKNGKLLYPDVHSRFSITEDGLAIKNFTEDDNGLYQCRVAVRSTGSLKKQNIKVEAHTPPKFITLPEDTSAIRDQDAELRCEATGHPDPTYEWYKLTTGQNRPLVGARYFVKDTGSLVISSTNIDDAGEYRCEARNKAGSVDSKARLEIVVPPTMEPIKTYVQTELGIDVHMSCRGIGRPLPRMKWRRDKSNVDFVDGIQPTEGRIEVVHDRDDPSLTHLYIKSPEITDGGSYLCIGENEGGESEEKVTLTVEFPPVFNYPEVPFNYSWIGHAANLTCQALGEPAPKIEWYYVTGNHPFFNWRKILNVESRYKIQGEMRRSNLEITAREENDFREYRCNATNKHGKASSPFLLKKADPPGAPTVTFLDIQPNMVEVEFNVPPDNVLPVTGFIGQYKDFGANWISGTEVTETWNRGGNQYEDKYKLQNLEPTRRYIFRFAAVNDAGHGPWSTERDETLPDSRVPDSPEIISSGKSQVGNGYQLKWVIPKDGGKIILNYGVRWRRLYFENSKLVKVGNWYPEYTQTGRTEKEGDHFYFKIAAEQKLYAIKKLESEQFYEVELYARNEIGKSVSSKVTFETGKTSDPTPFRPLPAPLTLEALIGTVVLVVVLLAVVVDVCCYAFASAGVTHAICRHCCGQKDNDSEKDDINDICVVEVDDGRGSTDNIIKRAPPVDDCITAEDAPDLPPPPPDMLEGLDEKQPLTPTKAGAVRAEAEGGAV